MHKNFFIGAGLSAFFSQLMYWREGDICLYPAIGLSPFPIRRSQLEINKLLSTKAKSYGSCQYQLTHSTLHDRITMGGNSEIWGGFFNTANVKSLEKFISIGIKLVPLSLNCTGSHSNIESLVQLQEQSGSILKASNFLKPGYSYFLESIYFDSSKIILKCLSAENLDGTKFTAYGKVYICIGVVQTIDLLMRSKVIKTGDVLTLDEHEYELTIGGAPPLKNGDEDCIISYTPGRAANHLLGIQKANYKLTLSPFKIHQIFRAKINKLHLIAGQHSVIEKPIFHGGCKSINFGKSIHYCNLRINGERLIDITNRLTPNLYFVSMISVAQFKPGPISSDIFNYLENIANEH